MHFFLAHSLSKDRFRRVWTLQCDSLLPREAYLNMCLVSLHVEVLILRDFHFPSVGLDFQILLSISISILTFLSFGETGMVIEVGEKSSAKLRKANSEVEWDVLKHT